MTDRCSLLSCGEPADRTVEHPDRGTMDVCSWHARQIDRIGGTVMLNA